MPLFGAAFFLGMIMRFLLLFLLASSSASFSAEVYWGISTLKAANPQAVAKQLCDNNSSICIGFKLEEVPGRTDILNAIFYRDSQANPVWTTRTVTRFPCGYDGFNICSNFDYDSGVTVCSDGFYSNAANSLGYPQFVDTCDRPALKQCADSSFRLPNSFCPIPIPICNDYETCYAYAQTQIDCSNSSEINFSYTDSENFSYSCLHAPSTDPEALPDPDWFGCSSQTGFCGGIETSGNSSSSSSQASSQASSIGSSASNESSAANSSSNTGEGSSSGSGNTSSTSSYGNPSAGSGECDPTSSNYLSCITAGDNSQTIGTGSPTNSKGQFDETVSQEKLEQIKSQLEAEIEKIKIEIQSEFSSSITGSGSIQDFCINIFSAEVCFGMKKFEAYLTPIGSAIFLVACVLSFSIILRG